MAPRTTATAATRWRPERPRGRGVADAPFVILDEPTAHLDRHSERSVAAAVERLTEGRTALVIAHRAEPIARVDRTLELRDGVITEVPGIGARGE